MRININEKEKEIKYMIIDKLKKEKSNYSYQICGIKADYIFAIIVDMNLNLL